MALSPNEQAYADAWLKAKCEIDFSFFVGYVFKEYYGHAWVHNWHHDEIIKLIYRIESRKIHNAVINIPPRYGKTEILVILWLAWTFIRNPRAQFIHTSYSVELALKNSGMIRDILKSPPIQKYWPIKMRESADSKGLWLTEQGGGLKADSSMGAITGFGAGITGWVDGQPFDGAIVSDDPLKPQDARSEAARLSVNENFSNTLHSRRNHKQVPIIIIMQRLHVNDPSGYALEGNIMGDKFHHLKLPAIADGKPLWEYKHSINALETMRTADPSTFAGQYMQDPYIADGEVFKLDKCPRYHQAPPREAVTKVVHSWDTAYKAAQHNDPSVCTVWHVTPTMYYLVEVHRGRWEYPELRRRAFDLANEQKPDAILIEDKASGQTLIQEFQQSSTHPVIPVKVPPGDDKETRARTTAATVEAGKVAIPEKAAWLHDFEQEITAFPNGKHDDQVDSMSQFLRWMRDDGTTDEDYNKMYERLYGKR